MSSDAADQVPARHVAVLGAPPLRALLAELRDAFPDPPGVCLGSEHYEQLLALCEPSPADLVCTSFRTRDRIYVASGVVANSVAAPRVFAALAPDLVLLCAGDAIVSDDRWLAPLRAVSPPPRIVAWLGIAEGAQRESRGERAELALRAALESFGVGSSLAVVRGCLTPANGDAEEIERSLDSLRRALDAVPSLAPSVPQGPLLRGLSVVNLDCLRCGARFSSDRLLWPEPTPGVRSLIEVVATAGCVRSVRVLRPNRTEEVCFAVLAAEAHGCAAPGTVGEGGYVLTLVCACGVEVGWESRFVPAPRQHHYWARSVRVGESRH